MRFSHSFRVGKRDIDVHNHVNNVAYLRWIQDVAVAHWLNSANTELQKKFTWYVLRHEIDYKNRAFENDQIIATTWVGAASKVKCERITEIKRGNDVLVLGRKFWCLLDVKMNKPSRITGELRSIFGMK